MSLGARLAEGLVGPKDPEEATYWFGRAAEAGLPAAQWRYGIVLANGQGVPKNAVEGYFWLSLSGVARNRETLEILEKTAEELTEDERAGVRTRMTEWARDHLEQ